MQSKTHLRGFQVAVALALLTLLLVTAVNVLVDPYLVFETPRIDGINRWKTRFFWEHPGAKMRHVQAGHIRHLILGSSTAGGSMRPDHDAFAGEPAFNYALAGSTPRLQRLALLHAARFNPLSSVTVCIDFFAFNVALDRSAFSYIETALAESTDSGARWRRQRVALETSLLKAASGKTLKDAIGTIAEQQTPGVGQRYRDIRSDGFWSNPRPQDWSQLNAFRLIEKQYLTTGWFPDPRREFVLADAAGQSSLADMEALMRSARSLGIELRLIIMPSHARFAEAMHHAGLWPVFDQLKRDLLLIAQGAGMHGEDVPVWDFSGYNELTMEPIRDAQAESRWFEDSIHPTAATGDRLLARVLASQQSQSDGVMGVGMLLRRDVLERQLAETVRRRDEYLSEHAGDADDVEAIARETRAWRASSLQLSSGPD